MQYAPGEILKEQNLAEEFGTSRGPLREVLKQLEWKKLVVTMPRLGTQIAEIDFQKIIQVFQVRFDVEALAAKLACQNAEEEHLNRISKLIIKLEDDLDSNKSDPGMKFLKMDFLFREILHDAARNPILTEMSDFLYHLTLRINLLAFKKGDMDRCKPLFIDEMKAFQDAVSKKDEIKAADLRRKYLTEYLVGVKALF